MEIPEDLKIEYEDLRKMAGDDPKTYGQVVAASQMEYIERIARLEVALRDLLWASQVRPSCQRGVVGSCVCVDCANTRARAALSQK